MCAEENIINIKETDRVLLKAAHSLPPETVELIKGIVIGMQLQDSMQEKTAQSA